MSKDWNYAHMWDTMRRALEEQGERQRQEREERERHRIREMQTMFDRNGKIELYERTERNG